MGRSVLGINYWVVGQRVGVLKGMYVGGRGTLTKVQHFFVEVDLDNYGPILIRKDKLLRLVHENAGDAKKKETTTKDRDTGER